MQDFDPLIFRSLLFALTEFGLAGWVLRKGLSYKYVIAGILIFLGGYQLGEFIFLSSGNQFGAAFAAFSTTLLPPLGILLLSQSKIERYIYIGFQTVASFFGIAFLLLPGVIEGSTREFCLVKYADIVAGDPFIRAWSYYYILALSFAMCLAVFKFIVDKNKTMRKFYIGHFIAYASFFPTSVVLVLANGQDGSHLPSTMCALALIAAFVMAYISLKIKVPKKYKLKLKEFI